MLSAEISRKSGRLCFYRLCSSETLLCDGSRDLGFEENRTDVQGISMEIPS